jgi:hypothetical protein
MSLSRIVGMLLVCVIAVGCSKKRPASERAREELQALNTAYCSSNHSTAKEALFSYLKLLKTQKEQGVAGHDFLFGTFMTHGRLYLLYLQEGDTNAANAHHQEGIDLWFKWRASNGLPRIDATNYVWVVQQYDKGLDVKWRNIPKTSSPAVSETEASQ